MANKHIINSFQRGFTMLELIWVIFIIGIMLALTDLSSIFKLDSRAYAMRQTTNNRNITAALLQYARTSTTLGTVPAAYTGSGYFKTVYDPTNTTLASVFRAAGLAPSEINDDGTTGQRIRVYQNVQLTQSTPLDFQSGPVVTLTYQYGEVHQTTCRKNDASCNTASFPGASSAMDSTNYTTWTTTSPDLAPEFFSTLPLQKQMLALTNERLAALRDKLTGYYKTQQLSADPSATTNWYPYAYQSGSPSTQNPNLSGASAATNQFCYDGWYNLNGSTVNILAQLGLSKSEYGTTAWGGQIEYCRDYDPTLSGADTQPHFAALRVNQDVSTGVAPGSTASSNIFITF